MPNEKLVAEFKAHGQIVDELLKKATKEQLSTVARILALQSAHYARKYGSCPSQISSSY